MLDNLGSPPGSIELADRLAILDILAGHSRGLDRLDAELLRSVFFEDAFCEYGFYNGEPGAFIEFAMAALGGALPRPILLGQMHGTQTAPVRAGERYVVVGWTLARSGRKHEVATALLDADGHVVAQSTQTWIEPRG